MTPNARPRHTICNRLHAIPFAATLLAVSLLSLAGCSSLQVKLGMKVDLTTIPVTSVEITLPKGPGIAPGQKSPLVVKITQPDGKVLLTEGAGAGKVQWKDLNVTASVVTVNNKGVIALARDPRVSDGKTGHVTVSIPSHPDVKAADLDIPFRYDVKFTAHFDGAKGSDGMNGTDGTDGISGSPGSTDPNNPSAGGNGSNGSDGSNGGDGGAGGDAPNVQILVAVQQPADPTGHNLLQISVTANGKSRFFLVDPQGGSLYVSADGGQGGSGGRGGRGGRGGSGGIGSPNGSDGMSGSDGHNGSDGSAGRGGLITVTYDSQAQAYLTALHLSSSSGPKPVLTEGHVPAPW
jgi:hypothetical protein